MNSLKKIYIANEIIGQYGRHSHEVIKDRLSSYIDGLHVKEVDDFLIFCCKHKILSEVLNVSGCNRNTYLSDSINTGLSAKIILKTFSIFVVKNKDFFNSFYKLKKELENEVIIGIYDNCKKILEEIEIKFGLSLWLIDAKMSVLSNFNKFEELSEYKILLESNSVSHISQIIFTKHMSQSIDVFLNNVLDNIILEFRQNNQSLYADLISVLVLQSDQDSDCNIDILLQLTILLNPIDRMYLYKKIATNYLVASDCYTSKWEEELINFVTDISKEMIDPIWRNIDRNFKAGPCIRIGDDSRNLIELYTMGDYCKVIEECEVILRENPRDFSVVELYIRSIIYSDNKHILEEPTQQPRLQDIIINAYYSLLETTEDYIVCKNILETISMKNICFDFVSSIRPLYLSAYPSVNQKSLINSCNQLVMSEFNLTPKYYKNNKINNITEHQSLLYGLISKEQYLTLTPSRKLRYELEKTLENDEISHEKVEELLSKIEKESDLLSLDFERIWLMTKFKIKMYPSIFRRVSIECIKNRENAILYPISEIADIILGDLSEYTSDLSALICLYLNFRLYRHSSKELVAEFFEDYITSLNIIKPSDLDSTWAEGDIEKIFFLEHICCEEIIGILVEIDSKQKLLYERLKVIQVLKNEFKVSNDLVANEEISIFEGLLREKLSKPRMGSKITIDTQGLKKSKIEEYESSLSYLQLIEEISDTDLQEFFSQESIENKSKKETILINCYTTVYDKIISDFIFNEDFGLIRYLSSEIRHGVMPNQIRSVLEAYQIVTVKAKEDEYEKNLYWRAKYSLTAPESFLDHIDDQLSWFSTEVDKLIALANSWPYPTKDFNDEVSAFNFSYTADCILNFRRSLSNATGSDDFFEACTEVIWDKVGAGFINMKKLINESLKPKFNILFDELISRLSMNQANFEFTLLLDDIYHAKYKVIEELTLIENWFCRPSESSEDEIEVPLIDVIAFATESVKGIYQPKAIGINKAKISNWNLLNLKRSEVLGLTGAMVTVFQNAITHGVVEEKISISIGIVGQNIVIAVSNKVNKSSIFNINDKDLVNKVKKFDKNNSNNRLTTEGGTGLYKAYRYIVDFFDDASFNISLDNDDFYQKIILRKQ